MDPVTAFGQALNNIITGTSSRHRQPKMVELAAKAKKHLSGSGTAIKMCEKAWRNMAGR